MKFLKDITTEKKLQLSFNILNIFFCFSIFYYLLNINPFEIIKTVFLFPFIVIDSFYTVIMEYLKIDKNNGSVFVTVGLLFMIIQKFRKMKKEEKKQKKKIRKKDQKQMSLLKVYDIFEWYLLLCILGSGFFYYYSSEIFILVLNTFLIISIIYNLYIITKDCYKLYIEKL